MSLSGSCAHAFDKLRSKLATCIAAVRGRQADRRTQIAQANAFILGHGLQKGVAIWATFESMDRAHGPIVRTVLSSNKGGVARARAIHAPAWQVHAPQTLPSDVNAGVLRPRRLSSALTGYGLWHPFAAAGAGAAASAAAASVLPAAGARSPSSAAVSYTHLTLPTKA